MSEENEEVPNEEDVWEASNVLNKPNEASNGTKEKR